MRLIAVMLSCLVCAGHGAAAEFKGFGASLPAGPYHGQGMDQELKVSYWPDQPPVPAKHLRDTTERRNFFNWFAPKGVKGPLPAVIMIHGGGFGAGHPDQYHSKAQAAQWLTSHGYVVFSLGYTLRSSQGRLYASIDARQAIRFIKQHATRFRVDPERIGAWGFSAGSMLLTKLLIVPDRGSMKISSQSADGKKINEVVSADTGPLARTELSSWLRVVVCSSCHEIHPKNAAKSLANPDLKLPKAVLIYQAPGEKPWYKGRAPEGDAIRKAYTDRGVVFDGYGVPGGKHCPKLSLTVERDGQQVLMRDVVFETFEKYLKGDG